MLGVNAIEPREVPLILAALARPETLTAAQALDQAVTAALARVLSDGQGLEALLARVAREGPAADVCFDNRWGGLHEAVGGLARFGRGAASLPLEPTMAERVSLAELVARSFTGPDLRWLNGPYIDEWREGRYRLMRLDTAPEAGRLGLRAAIAKLGLDNELTAVIAGQAYLAKVLGITDGQGTDASEQVDQWNDTVRAYVIAVLHYGKDQAKPGTAVYRALLEPLDAAWERQRQRRRPKGEAAVDGGEGGSTP